MCLYQKFPIEYKNMLIPMRNPVTVMISKNNNNSSNSNNKGNKTMKDKEIKTEDKMINKIIMGTIIIITGIITIITIIIIMVIIGKNMKIKMIKRVIMRMTTPMMRVSKKGTILERTNILLGLNSPNHIHGTVIRMISPHGEDP